MSTIQSGVPAFQWPSTESLVTWLRKWWMVLLAFLVVYAKIVAELVGEWWTNDDYSHGFLVPFAVAYLLYERRSILAALPQRPSWIGLPTILSSQIVLIVGFLGAEYFLQRVSLVIFVAGLVLYMWGWSYFKETAFGMVLILLAIPLPAIIFNAIAFPLQLLASSWAESFLRVCQIPVYRDGNILQLSQQLLNVTEACSGIRSLMSLVTLAVMLAYFLPMRWWARAAFILTSVPVALAANSFRVAGTGLLATWFGEKAAEGFFHLFSGWVVFVLAFVILFGELLLLQKISNHPRFAKKDAK